MYTYPDYFTFKVEITADEIVHLSSFDIQFVWEESFLKMSYDIIITSKVPNLGHVISILYLPTKILRRVRKGSKIFENGL